MTGRLAKGRVRLVLLDIEGTTTPIAFVHDVLFPFARAHLADWCRDRGDSREYQDVVRRLSIEHAGSRARREDVPPWREDSPASLRQSLASYAIWLMDRDRKSPGLKLLQGLIWEQGYRSGALRGVVYRDVPPALHEWRAAGIDIAIYSSGSQLAQRLLFASTEFGDLTTLIAGFFDTAVGPKQSTESYTRILTTLGHEPSHALFASDSVAELDAARRAGLDVVLSIRPGNIVQPGAHLFKAVSNFADIG